jgi:hypothetical protein
MVPRAIGVARTPGVPVPGVPEIRKSGVLMAAVAVKVPDRNVATAV